MIYSMVALFARLKLLLHARYSSIKVTGTRYDVRQSKYSVMIFIDDSFNKIDKCTLICYFICIYVIHMYVGFETSDKMHSPLDIGYMYHIGIPYAYGVAVRDILLCIN